MIHSFQILCDLIETQSFTETAEKNFLTQSAISHHLKSLETKLGVQLVERGYRKLRLTDYGKLVYGKARNIVDEFEELQTLLKQPQDEIRGTLRLGSIYTAGLHLLLPYTAEFAKKYPQTTLRLKYLLSPEIYEGVLQNRLDLGVVDFPRQHAGIQIVPFHSEPLVMITPPNHPWAKLKQISLRKLGNEPFIAASEELPIRQVFDKIFSDAGVRVHIAYTFNNVEVVKKAVATGLGVSIVPKTAVQGEIRSGELSSVKFMETFLEWPLALIHRKHTRQKSAVRKFIELMTC
ncbi:MAG: LysR family transcriptional regulator [Candidatus Omnitrophica bacterium]|nr:LysR family transcriptional regulator [Candidatus Omnitrophota bacterium]